ncbi:MAG TPA: glycosyltransferase family 2 protein [Gammaproteobacteria bacterium]|nr:glycosyltransferase family 2 protein [Gammaproteobacteria bacterium]
MKSPLVTVIIVNSNAGELLVQSVHGVLSSDSPVEIIVVDNGSVDGSIERLRSVYGLSERVTIVELRENTGFTHANNLAIGMTKGEYILALNPDNIIQPDTISGMLKVLAADPDAGMAGCLIKNPDGSEQAGCRRAVPTPWRTVVRILHLDKIFPSHPRFRNFVLSQTPLPDNPVYVEAISGAFMLIKKEALSEVGLMDEAYFIHCDDLDWCMRFRQLGWKILFVPNIVAVHHKGACSYKKPVFVLWHKHRGMVYFYKKFFKHQYPAPLMWFVIGTVWARFIGLVCIEGIKLLKNRGVSGREYEPGKLASKIKSIPLPSETKILQTSKLPTSHDDEIKSIPVPLDKVQDNNIQAGPL